jgi:hypothetical protein
VNLLFFPSERNKNRNMIPSVTSVNRREGGYLVIFMKDRNVKTEFFWTSHGEGSP